MTTHRPRERQKVCTHGNILNQKKEKINTRV